MSRNAQENPVVQTGLDLMNFSNWLSGTYREVWFRKRPHVHAPQIPAFPKPGKEICLGSLQGVNCVKTKSVL
jgi:hypothetical protein